MEAVGGFNFLGFIEIQRCGRRSGQNQMLSTSEEAERRCCNGLVDVDRLAQIPKRRRLFAINTGMY